MGYEMTRPTAPHVVLRDFYVRPKKLTHHSFRGINKEQFDGILSGEVRITPATAASLAATLGTPVKMWLDLDRMADRWDR